MPAAAAYDGKASQLAIYFDGVTNRRHVVAIAFGANLDVVEDGVAIASWPYDDLRAADGGPGTLRLKCASGLPLARLEVFDPAAQADIRKRARFLESDRGGSAQTGRIVAWSLAAIVSIVLIVTYGMPLVAERLTPLIPISFERRLGAMTDNQVRSIFGGKTCSDAQGRCKACRDIAPSQPSGNAAADRGRHLARR